MAAVFSLISCLATILFLDFLNGLPFYCLCNVCCLELQKIFNYRVDLYGFQKEFKYRKDFRNYTVFTIDPKTACDMDDALHIRRIDDCDGNGTPGWEVGVHIADVSHFVPINSELDSWAADRANTFYLVDEVS